MSVAPPDVLGPVDRRTFLRGTAGGAAALALATVLPAGCAGYPPVPNLRTFSAKHFAVLRALAGVFVPASPGLVSPAELGLASHLDTFLADEPPHVRTQLRQALLLIEYGGVWWGPQRRRFTRMTTEIQARYLQEWLEASSAFRRQVAQTFRRACLNVYYSDERVWAAIGYDGPLV